MRISDRSSDVCSSDLKMRHDQPDKADRPGYRDRAADADADPKQQPKPHRAKPDAERARAVLAKRQRIERAAVPQQKCCPNGDARPRDPEIGRASCRERVCQYAWFSVVAGPLQKKTTITKLHQTVQKQK